MCGPMLSATVIVPTYNRPDALARTLDALLAMDFPQDLFDIVVVDTGRKELGAEQVADARGAQYLRQSNVGVAAARNRGAEIAAGELLLFVDDDTVVDKSNLRRHEAIQQEGEKYVVAGHRTLDPSLRACWRALRLVGIGSLTKIDTTSRTRQVMVTTAVAFTPWRWLQPI